MLSSFRNVSCANNVFVGILLKGYLRTGLTTRMIYFTNIYADILCVVEVNTSVTIQFPFVCVCVFLKSSIRGADTSHSFSLPPDFLGAVSDNSEFRSTSS
jgi:hypothetical protein